MRRDRDYLRSAETYKAVTTVREQNLLQREILDVHNNCSIGAGWIVSKCEHRRQADAAAEKVVWLSQRRGGVLPRVCLQSR
jgi:hypothetical protein